MGQKAVLHTIRLTMLSVLLGAFWVAPSVIFAKNNTENAPKNASAITITFSVTNVACNGGNNGALTATPTGGVAPYTYLWSNGKTTATITGLTAGFYTVIVTDASGAQANDQKEVLQPQSLGSGAAQVQGQICMFQADGIAKAWAFGGVPPYSYNWSNGQTGVQISGLAFGTYSVTVTDANGCTSLNSTVVTDNTAEGIWIAVYDDLVCPGQLGSLSANAMSGTQPYVYQWSNGQSTQVISGLSPGTYTVTISDASGCSGIKTAQVTALPAVVANATSSAAGCNLANGSATVNPSGGSGTYTISWSNGQSGNTITNLAAGTYSAPVTDSEGCSATTSTTVQGGAGSNLNLTTTVISNAGCAGAGGSASIDSALLRQRRRSS